MLTWLTDWLWGYDFFISYAHKDGSILEDGRPRSGFVRSLVNKLQDSKEHFSVFHDETEYDPGTELNEATKRYVRASTKLLLVARPFAMGSKWVHDEVKVAIDTGTQVVVVDINNTYDVVPSDHRIRTLIGDSLLRHCETLEDSDGSPSDALVDKLVTASQRSRRQRRRLQIVGATAMVLAVLTTLAVVFWRSSESNLRSTRQRAAELAFDRARYLSE
jgi:hypothetical protein